MNPVNEIPFHEIEFESSSFIDPIGRVFYWNSKVFRALKNKAISNLELLEQTNIETLYKKGLVHTGKTSYMLPGFDEIITHEKVSFVSYPAEWCSSMLRDAGLLVLDLQEELNKDGYHLKDGHPWNVLFEGVTPIFVDWGSIRKNCEGDQIWFYNEFRRRFIYPLYLKWAGLNLLAKYILLDPTHFIPDRIIFQSIFRKTGLNHWINFFNTDYKSRKNIRSGNLSVLNHLRDQLSAVPLNYLNTEWSNYTGIWEDGLQPNESWRQKSLSVFKIMDEIRPKSVLDIGANKGWYSLLAGSFGSKVIASDIDETSISALYQYNKERKLSVLPLLLDICEPTPAHGPRGIMHDARQRLGCELVLALALSHHLIAKRRLTFEQLSLYLSEFSQKYLLVEFVTIDDIHIANWDFSHIDNYSVEGFIDALKKYFRKVDILPSYPNTRVLLFCSKW